MRATAGDGISTLLTLFRSPSESLGRKANEHHPVGFELRCISRISRELVGK